VSIEPLCAAVLYSLRSSLSQAVRGMVEGDENSGVFKGELNNLEDNLRRIQHIRPDSRTR